MKPQQSDLVIQVIASKSTCQNPPILLMEGTSFLYLRHKNMFLVAATRANPNCALIFEFLKQKIRILKSYLGEDFNDVAVQTNFTLIYELLDETMDYGFPQNCSIDVLRLYINLGATMQAVGKQKEGAALTSQITGAIDWRQEGIRYRKNEVYIDVHETVSLLTSVSGTILRAEVNGKVMMKAMLTGMPECKFGLNDKLIMEKEASSATTKSGKKITGVEIDDCTFHRYLMNHRTASISLFSSRCFSRRCVRLGKFDTERTITFITPDGEFELMRYRVTEAMQPFRLIPTYREEGKTKLLINVKVVQF